MSNDLFIGFLFGDFDIEKLIFFYTFIVGYNITFQTCIQIYNLAYYTFLLFLYVSAGNNHFLQSLLCLRVPQIC